MSRSAVSETRLLARFTSLSALNLHLDLLLELWHPRNLRNALAYHHGIVGSENS